ncbi:conserved hypothetical protein [Escherichia coli APEC O1]|uniref:Uncharacterized protein n=1 Tax=Escherichia coli O1:K1 / APEC TaxID=405955 RepID=A0A0H2Z638_ECOK1|nr:conserved hypothetical protein [Escherichia coli APEC O1]
MNTRSGFQGLSPGMRINKWIMLPSGSVIAGRDFVLFCFFPGVGFEFSQKVVHRSHTGMRITLPHKNHSGFFDAGYGGQCSMIVFVSLIDFR